MKIAVGLIVLAVVAGGIIGLIPDIVRYMKIRSM